MKQDKVFVRFNHFDEHPPPRPHRSDRNDRRPHQKKKYAQKQKHGRVRQGFKAIFDSFEAIPKPSEHIEKLLKKYPTFFNREGKQPQKQSNQLLNQSLILYPRKFFQGLKEHKREPEAMVSSSDPDWNSDDDVDCNMESKIIEEAIIEKTVEKMKDKPIKRPNQLLPHQKKFLEDQLRKKRQLEQEEGLQAQTAPVQKQEKNIQAKAALPQFPQQKIVAPMPTNVERQSVKVDWSNYQQKQLSTFIDMGFMTKIQENEDETPVEVIEDDDMFNEDSSKSDNKSNSKSNSSQDEDDDIFGDETPTTTIKTKIQTPQPKVETQKTTQGTVVINDHVFSNIAESIGMLPSRCNWIIKNEFNKYKVTTDYMDAYYRKQKMFEILPLISLNHSQFVNNEKVQTAEGVSVLRDFNARKTQTYVNNSYRPKFNYKQKQTHPKKR